MKKSIHTLIGTMVMPALLLLLASCSGTRGRHALVQAERIVEEHPDSALALISDVKYQSLPDDEAKALYGLLYTQAMYKCYKPVVSDSLIDFSIQHYTSVADRPRLAASYYYKGAVNDDRGDSKTAILWLKRAEELSEETDDKLLKHKVYYLMCYANSKAGNAAKKLEYGKKLQKSSIALSNNEDLMVSYNLISNAYYDLGSPDSSITFLRKALSSLHYLNKRDRSIMLANLGFFYYKKGNMPEAGKFSSAAIRLYPISLGYLVLGDLQYNEKNPAKANEYWAMALKVSTDDEQRLNVYESLITFNVEKGNYRDALEMYKKADSVKTAVREKASAKEILEIQMKYDKERTDRIWYQKLMYILAAGLLLFVILVAALWYFRRRMRYYRTTMQGYSSKIERIEAEIDLYSKNIELLKSSDADKTKEVRILQKKIEVLRAAVFDELGKGNGIYEEIRQRKTIISYTDADIAALIDFYKVIRKDVFLLWEETYDRLSIRQYLYLILRDMELNDHDMAEIMGVTEVAVRSTRSRLKKRLKNVANNKCK